MTTTREQWILGSQFSSAISCLNAPFCDGGPAEGPNKVWLAPIAEKIAECGIFSIEDAIDVLEMALAIAIKNKEDAQEAFKKFKSEMTEDIFIDAYTKVDKYVEERYRVISTITDVLDPNTGDFDGRWIKVDYTLDAEQALFVLLHLFGHTVQWNVSEEFRKLGQETVEKATEEQLLMIQVYEKQATQYSVQLLHECGIFDLDQWITDWWIADWKWLSHFYKTGEKLDQKDVRNWIEAGTTEKLTPLAIPEFDPKTFVSRWAF